MVDSPFTIADCLPKEGKHEQTVADNAQAHLFNCAYEGQFNDRTSGARLVDAADKKIEFDPEAVEKAAQDLAKGTWSPETRAYFKHVYDDASKDPKANAKTIYDELRSLGVAINGQAIKDGIKTQINLAAVASPETGAASYWFLMNGPGMDLNSEAQDVMSGKGGPRVAKAGEYHVKQQAPGQKA